MVYFSHMGRYRFFKHSKFKERMKMSSKFLDQFWSSFVFDGFFGFAPCSIRKISQDDSPLRLQFLLLQSPGQKFGRSNQVV
jgi:hypothetical protein